MDGADQTDLNGFLSVFISKISAIHRLHGRRRYDSTDGGGRATQGAVAESNAGAIAECHCFLFENRIHKR